MTRTALKALRAALGWTQTQAARQLGVTRNTITRWEMGLHPIPHWVPRLLKLLSPPRR